MSASSLLNIFQESHIFSVDGRYLWGYVLTTQLQDLTSDDIADELRSACSKGSRQAFEYRATGILCRLLGVDARAETKPDPLPFLQLLMAPFYRTSLEEGKLRGTLVDRSLDEALHVLEDSAVSPSVRLLQLSHEALRDSATKTKEVLANLQTQLREIKMKALSLYHTKVLLLSQYRKQGFRGENGMLFRTDKGQIGKCRRNVEPEDEIWRL